MDFGVLADCMNSTYGNMYEHDMAVLTELLYPQPDVIPWITLNWVRNVSLADLKKLPTNF